MSLLLIVLQLLFTYTPPPQQMFKSTRLDSLTWMVIGGLGLAKFFAVEAEKCLLRRFGIKQM